MYEILTSLPPGSVVLDLGSGSGSFPRGILPLKVIRADLAPVSGGGEIAVACTASALPFATNSFQAVILNHSLEHFEGLGDCVSEIARVLAPEGYLYVAVPDASTLTDRFYRWVARGGGHVNLFTNPRQLIEMFTTRTETPHSGTRTLFTSWSFLNRKNSPARPPRKLLLLLGGNESFLRLLSLVFRWADRLLRTRLSVYGWALYFGKGLNIEEDGWSNVCVRCGSGHSRSVLTRSRIRRRFLVLDSYSCPQCGTENWFTNW